MLHNEIWAHLLVYNLIRKVMAQAAVAAEINPQTISFKGTRKPCVSRISFRGACRAGDRRRRIGQAGNYLQLVRPRLAVLVLVTVGGDRLLAEGGSEGRIENPSYWLSLVHALVVKKEP